MWWIIFKNYFLNTRKVIKFSFKYNENLKFKEKKNHTQKIKHGFPFGVCFMSECFYFFVLDSILKTSYESSSDLIFYDKMVSVISITFNGHMHLSFVLSLRLSCGLCILNHLDCVLWIMLIGSLLYQISS